MLNLPRKQDQPGRQGELICLAHGNFNVGVLAAYVLERFELFSEAVEYASVAMTSDVSRCGSGCRKDSDDYPPAWIRMGMLIARCNAKLGKAAEAKAGFEVAAENAAKSGVYCMLFSKAAGTY